MNKESICKRVDSEKIYKFLTYAFLILMVVWRIPFLNKGIDYTDTGFNMTNYRNFFDNLSSNGIGMFFTNFVGAVIYNLLPSHQLLVFRIMHLLMWSATFLIIYFTFRRQTPSYFNVLLSALLLLFSTYQKIGEAMYSYYPFSMLMVAIATYLIYTALTRDKKLRLFFGGAVLGLNVGVRLPNVLFFALVAGVFWYYLCKKEYKTGFVRSAVMLGGALAGLAVMLTFEMVMLGSSAVQNSASGYSNLASSSTQDHGIINQIVHIFEQLYVGVLSLIIYICPVLLASAVFVFVYRLVFKKHKEKVLFKLMMYLGVGLIACAWIAVRGMIISTRFVHIFGMIALVIGAVGVFALMRKHPELSAGALMCIISAGCIIVGTDLGITRFVDVLPQLCVALLFGTVYIVPRADAVKHKIKFNIALWFNILAKITVAIIITFSVINNVFTMVPYVYNDAKFGELTTTVRDEIPVLRGMKTTPERAESINNLYEAMTHCEAVKDKEVVAVGMFPLLFNIIDNDNYFNTPCIDYNSVGVAGLVARYERKNEEGINPVIVISKIHMIQNGLEEYCDDPDKAALIDRMISENEYELLFTDTYFDVWVPVG